MPTEARSLLFAVRMATIVISTTLLIIALMPITELAMCKQVNGNSTSVSLQQLVGCDEHGFMICNNEHGIMVYWLLWSSIILGLTRLATHSMACVSNTASTMFRVMDILASMVTCVIIITAIITIMYRVLSSEDCEFMNGASPFVGLLVASSGTTLAMATFEVCTMYAESSSPYEELSVQQQQDEEVVMMAMTGHGDCTSGSSLGNMKRTEIESLHDDLETAICETEGDMEGEVEQISML